MKTISIVGLGFLRSALKLFEALDAFEPKGANEVQTSHHEHGLSASIIALQVFTIESLVRRAQYFDYEASVTKGVPILPDDSVLKFFKANLVNDPNLYADLEELFILRDCIAHNHLWEIDVYWDNAGELRASSFPSQPLPWFGDKKFKNALSLNGPTTARNKFQLIPTKIGYSDVVGVFKICKKVFDFLEVAYPNTFNIRYDFFQYKGKGVSFEDFVNSL